MRVAAISDTHGHHRQLTIPDGLDVLVHCGDITPEGELPIVEDFADWMASQNVPHKIVIAGNHDITFDPAFRDRYSSAAEIMLMRRGIHYLFDSSVTIDGYKFYGTPWVPNLPLWAFYHAESKNHFTKIPDDVDVLVSHAPPRGLCDKVYGPMDQTFHFGCQKLYRRVADLRRLKLHLFGHVHDSGGKTIPSYEGNDGSWSAIFHNAAVLDGAYQLARPSPVVHTI